MADAQDWGSLEKIDEKKIDEVISGCRYISSCELSKVESDSKQSATKKERCETKLSKGRWG